MNTPRRGLRARGLLAPHIVVLFGIVAVTAITFAVIIATLDRGFDWSDEGFVYAMVASNRSGTGEFWSFQHLLSPVYDLLGSSVLAFRVLRLLAYVGLGIALTLLARALLRSRGITIGRVGWVFVGLVAQIGTFAAWSYPPRYLGYNELSSWFTQLGVALVIFLLLASPVASGVRTARRWSLWPITGVVLSILIVSKITSGIFLSLVALIAALVANNGGACWKRLSGLAGGSVSGLLIMLVAGFPLLSYFEASAHLGADSSVQSGSPYSFTALLWTYLRSTAVTVGKLAVPVVLAAVILLAIRGFHDDAAPARRAITSIENVVLFLAVVLSVMHIGITNLPGDLDTWESLGVSEGFLLVLAVLSFAVLATRAAGVSDPSPRRRNTATAFAFVIFAIGPLISALGTNNPIFGQTLFSATMWAVGAGVGLVLLWQNSAASSAAVRLLPLLLLGVMVASAGLAVAGDVFLHPYRTAPYFTQKSTLEVGDLRGIRVTEGEADLYNWLHDAGIRQDAQGVPTLSIATPGALLAFNASGWSAIWPGTSWASAITQSCSANPPRDLIVLQAASSTPGSDAYDRLVSGLDACGIKFPADFVVVDRHAGDEVSHDIRIWRLG